MAFLLIIPVAVGAAATAIGGVVAKVRISAQLWIKRMGLWSTKTPVKDVTELRPGDHICYPTAALSIAYHHAIVKRVIDKNKIEVIHYSGPPGENNGSSFSSTSGFSSSKKDKAAALIRKDAIDLEQHAKDGKLYRVDYENDGNCYPPNAVVERAESKIGEAGLESKIGEAGLTRRGYDLLKNNCEHFATWCKTGKAFSRQSCLKYD